MGRVRRSRSLDELRESLGERDSAISAHGDVLEFVHRAKAERVHCSGGIQLPMSRVGRSDVWELSARGARLDEAVISLIPKPVLRRSN